MSSRSESAPRRSRNLGRLIATVLFWAGALYMATVGLVSVVPQVFRPEAAAAAPGIDCATGIRELKGELSERAAERVARGGVPDDGPELAAWFRAWDRRYYGLAPVCEGSLSDAWVDLGRLRERVETTLDRVDRRHGPLSRRIDRALGSER